MNKRDPPRFLFPHYWSRICTSILLFLFLRPFECSLLLVSDDVSSIIRQLGESIKTDRFSFPSLHVYVRVCIVSKVHVSYPRLFLTFSPFFRATFDYPRLSLCHVKNYWICYSLYFTFDLWWKWRLFVVLICKFGFDLKDFLDFIRITCLIFFFEEKN